MDTTFRDSFYKDIKKCADKSIKEKVLEVIDEVEKATSVNRISNLKKLKGFKNAYRIKIKDYRVGLEIEGTNVSFVRLLHRKEVYRYFP